MMVDPQLLRSYLLEELFSLFNKKISDYVEVPLDLWYRFVFSDGKTFDYSGDEKSMEKEIQKFSDKDFEGYNNLVKFTEKIFNKGLLIYQINLLIILFS